MLVGKPPAVGLVVGLGTPVPCSGTEPLVDGSTGGRSCCATTGGPLVASAGGPPRGGSWTPEGSRTPARSEAMKIDDTLSRWSRRKALVIGNPRDFANATAQLSVKLNKGTKTVIEFLRSD
jgi:hypothetical protein